MNAGVLETIIEKFDGIISELATISCTSLDGIEVNLGVIGDELETHNKLMKQQNELLAKLLEKNERKKIPARQ